MATYEEIVASKDTVPEPIEVHTPEWGGKTYLKVLDGSFAGAANKLSEKIRAMRKNISEEAALLASWIVLCMCDKKGKRSLKESQVLCLLDASLCAFQRVGIKASQINGMTDDLVGNSEATPADSSPSA